MGSNATLTFKSWQANDEQYDNKAFIRELEIENTPSAGVRLSIHQIQSASLPSIQSTYHFSNEEVDWLINTLCYVK